MLAAIPVPKSVCQRAKAKVTRQRQTLSSDVVQPRITLALKARQHSLGQCSTPQTFRNTEWSLAPRLIGNG